MDNTELIKERGLEKEFTFRTSRSSGAGGQHVNKTETRVELIWHIASSSLLSEREKTLIQQKLVKRIDSEGNLLLSCQETRSQLRNKEKVMERFFELISTALIERKKRKKRKPSKEAIQNRLRKKRLHSEKKQRRGKVDW